MRLSGMATRAQSWSKGTGAIVRDAPVAGEEAATAAVAAAAAAAVRRRAMATLAIFGTLIRAMNWSQNTDVTVPGARVRLAQTMEEEEAATAAAATAHRRATGQRAITGNRTVIRATDWSQDTIAIVRGARVAAVEEAATVAVAAAEEEAMTGVVAATAPPLLALAIPVSTQPHVA